MKLSYKTKLKLARYLEGGGLSPRVQREVERLLAMNPQAEEYLQQMKLLSGLISSSAAEITPQVEQRMSEAICRQLRKKSIQSSTLFPFRLRWGSVFGGERVGWVFALSLLLLIFGVFLQLEPVFQTISTQAQATVELVEASLWNQVEKLARQTQDLPSRLPDLLSPDTSSAPSDETSLFPPLPETSSSQFAGYPENEGEWRISSPPWYKEAVS